MHVSGASMFRKTMSLDNLPVGQDAVGLSANDYLFPSRAPLRQLNWASARRQRAQGHLRVVRVSAFCLETAAEWQSSESVFSCRFHEGFLDKIDRR
jgi:hypothetical protein